MILLYRLNSSDKIMSVTIDTSPIDGKQLIDIILKSIFYDKEPSCDLELMDKDKKLHGNNTIPFVFKRIYRQRFKSKKVVHKVNKKIKRKRRWKSPPKRWRSKSPEIKRQRWG